MPSTKLANPTSFVDTQERPRRSFASDDESITEVKRNSLPLNYPPRETKRHRIPSQYRHGSEMEGAWAVTASWATGESPWVAKSLHGGLIPMHWRACRSRVVGKSPERIVRRVVPDTWCYVPEVSDAASPQPADPRVVACSPRPWRARLAAPRARVTSRDTSLAWPLASRS